MRVCTLRAHAHHTHNRSAAGVAQRDGASRLSDYTPDEMMTVAAARRLENGVVCFVGIGLPSLAANLARRLHAPDCVLVYESGAIGAKPSAPPLSIGDGELADTADAVVSVPEMFAYWLQGGRIDVGFLGAAQIDRFGRLNSTVIGDYDHPQVRLPGGGGAPEIALGVRDVFVMLRQSPRTFVEELDFVTSLGDRVRVVVTDLGMLEPRDGELTLTRLHPGVTVEEAREATGWDLRVADDLTETEPPTDGELEVLRSLRTKGGGA
jgi:glutaconate CoA-transferase, subunit B